MNAIEREIERMILDDLRAEGDHLPPTEIRFARSNDGENVEIIVGFGAEAQLHRPPRITHHRSRKIDFDEFVAVPGAERLLNGHPRNVRAMEAGILQEAMRIWSAHYEDAQVERETAAIRAAIRAAHDLNANPALLMNLEYRLRQVESHARAHHRGVEGFIPYMQMPGPRGPACPGDSDEIFTVTREIEPLPQPNAERMRMIEAVRMLGEQIDSAAYAKGLTLLKQNLTKVQLAQYEKDMHFDVKGGKSGKTYRIHHGRQMNISELDKKGKRVCGWCFLPQGGLVAGDVMLAQKTALECCEEQALKVANRF